MLRFELRYRLTRPVTWFYLIVFIAQGLIFMGAAGVVLAGSAPGDPLYRGKVWIRIGDPVVTVVVDPAAVPGGDRSLHHADRPGPPRQRGDGRTGGTLDRKGHLDFIRRCTSGRAIRQHVELLPRLIGSFGVLFDIVPIEQHVLELALGVHRGLIVEMG